MTRDVEVLEDVASLDWLSVGGMRPDPDFKTLVLGIGMRITAVAGAVQTLFVHSASPVPESNPLVDEHVIYALACAHYSSPATGTTGAGKGCGGRDV